MPSTSRPVFTESWHFWATAGAIGLGVFALDRPLHSLALDHHFHSPATDQIFNNGVVHFGEIYPFVLGVSLFGLDGVASGNQKSLRVANELAIAPAFTHIIAGSAKKGFGRLRPSRSNSPYEFCQGNDSFVSGHSATAWTWATIIAKNYPYQHVDWISSEPLRLVPILCYSTATLVSFQRLYDNRHWASDVFFGGLTGYFSGSLAVWLADKYSDRLISVVPGNPIQISFKF